MAHSKFSQIGLIAVISATIICGCKARRDTSKVAGVPGQESDLVADKLFARLTASKPATVADLLPGDPSGLECKVVSTKYGNTDRTALSVITEDGIIETADVTVTFNSLSKSMRGTIDTEQGNGNKLALPMLATASFLSDTERQEQVDQTKEILSNKSELEKMTREEKIKTILKRFLSGADAKKSQQLLYFNTEFYPPGMKLSDAKVYNDYYYLTETKPIDPPDFDEVMRRVRLAIDDPETPQSDTCQSIEAGTSAPDYRKGIDALSLSFQTSDSKSLIPISDAAIDVLVGLDSFQYDQLSGNQEFACFSKAADPNITELYIEVGTTAKYSTLAPPQKTSNSIIPPGAILVLTDNCELAWHSRTQVRRSLRHSPDYNREENLAKLKVVHFGIALSASPLSAQGNSTTTLPSRCFSKDPIRKDKSATSWIGICKKK